ncbi:MAG: Gfo/Idh/MocA family oxidoreductase [Tetrasphaera sp.]
MSKRLKVGVIGAGGISRTHMPGWQASEHAEVVAASDIYEPGLQDWGKTFGVTRLTTDWRELLADPAIDIIDICTPNMLHADQVIAALEAGKHVICEKPLAPTPDEIRRMIAARDRAGKLLMTAQHFRFKGNSQALKKEIAAGALGEIYHARSLDAAAQRADPHTDVYQAGTERRRPLHRHRRAHPGPDAVDDGQPQAGGSDRRGRGAPGARCPASGPPGATRPSLRTST